MINANTQNQSASFINFRLPVVAGILGCLVAALLAVLLPATDTYAATNKCRTMIYRADTAGYDSPYVQICADVNDSGEITGNISLSENQRSLLGVAVRKNDGGNGIAENIRVCQRTWLDDCESGTIKVYYAGNGPTADNTYTSLTNFNDFTDKVLYNISDIAGNEQSKTVDVVLSDGAVTQETITYRYNGIYDGSYADWQSAGSPDQNGKTYDDGDDTSTNTEDTEDGSDDDDSDPCYDNTSSVGWFVCPVITWIGGMMGGLYQDVVEPFLEVKSSLVSSEDSESGTYGAWGTFRDIANIIFVILAIVVILSQITGFGVSNYGIKKALPKIIVIAILVNLSYILCQLAVDVSNILGAGLNSFLTTMAAELPETAANEGDTNNPVVSFTATGIISVVIGIAILKTGGAPLVITLLLSLVAGLISLIFMFIVLGIRQAGVVLLVALAPVAIVCYALPNTEQIGRRWLNMFKALLMVYPIAGLLIGGSTLAARILLQAADGTTVEGTLIEILAMLLMVVPFFMLPSLLKKSIAGADKIFGSIVNKGEGLTGAAQNKVRGSQMMQRNRAKVASRRQLAGTRRRVGAASLASKALGKASKAPGVIGKAAAAGQRGMMNAYAKEMGQVAEADTENLQGYLGSMRDPKTGAYNEDKITETRVNLFDKMQRGEKLSAAEKKTYKAIADHYANIGDAKSLVAMGLKEDEHGNIVAQNTEAAKLLSDRAKSNHKIIDVAGGKKGNKAFADAIEKHGGDLSKMDYADSFKNMAPEEIAAQGKSARRAALKTMDMATLQNYANDSQFMNRIGKEARTDFLNAKSVDTGQSVAEIQAQEEALQVSEEAQRAERQQQEQEGEKMAREYENNIVANLHNMGEDEFKELHVDHQALSRFQPKTVQAIEREYNIRQNDKHDNSSSNSNDGGSDSGDGSDGS